MDASKRQELESKLGLELRRGIIVLAVMSSLDEPQYGYSLQEKLSQAGMEVEQGTLYPLLRRLHDQGLLESDWQLGESRPRKYYKINPEGLAMRASLKRHWEEISQVMNDLLEKFPEGE